MPYSVAVPPCLFQEGKGLHPRDVGSGFVKRSCQSIACQAAEIAGQLPLSRGRGGLNAE